MDGTSKRYIVTTDLEWPNGLAIDFACILRIASISFLFHEKYVFILQLLWLPINNTDCFSGPVILDRPT